MTTLPKLREMKVWRGRYLEVPFEINLHSIGEEHTPLGKGVWTYYLSILEPMFENPKDFESFWLQEKESGSHKFYDYYVSPIVDLEFHGGPTYYEPKPADPFQRRPYRAVKIGCDYNHLYDGRTHYTLKKITLDVVNSIKKLHELYPNLRKRCGWNGEWYPESEGSVNDHGVWMSFEGQEKAKKTLKEWRQE